MQIQSNVSLFNLFLLPIKTKFIEIAISVKREMFFFLLIEETVVLCRFWIFQKKMKIHILEINIVDSGYFKTDQKT
jgi:hypothetical protein